MELKGADVARLVEGMSYKHREALALIPSTA